MQNILRVVRTGKAGLCTAVLLGLFPASSWGAACLTAEPLFQLREGGKVALRQPAGMSIHGKRLFVLDDLNGRVVKYTLGGNFERSIPIPGGNRSSYLGLDLGGDDNIYLASSGAGKIVVIRQDGTLLREFKTGKADGTSEPVGLDVSRGFCFVADNEAHMVKVFDLNGDPLTEWGGLGDGPMRMRYPFRIVQDNQGRIIVSDSLNSRIKVYTPKGEPLLDFGTFGVMEGTLYRPTGVEVWEENLILVSDNYLGSVQVFDMKGNYRSTLCGADGKPMLFENPLSLAVTGSTIFVLETGESRVQALRVGGTR